MTEAVLSFLLPAAGSFVGVWSALEIINGSRWRALRRCLDGQAEFNAAVSANFRRVSDAFKIIEARLGGEDE